MKRFHVKFGDGETVYLVGSAVAIERIKRIMEDYKERLPARVTAKLLVNDLLRGIDGVRE